MSSMFCSCSFLNYLDISNFNTSQVINMHSMFYGCSSLNSLNLSSFHTSKVTDMVSMFYFCSSLEYLDLSNFDTSEVKDMSNMFYKCSSLNYLDVSNFDTSKVSLMTNIFRSCSSLTYLDLSGFNISLVTTGCSKLEYINFKLAKFDERIDRNYLFDSNIQNLMFCSKFNELSFLFRKNQTIYCNNNSSDNIEEFICSYSFEINNISFCDFCGKNNFIKYI